MLSITIILPPEILDHIIDIIADDNDNDKNQRRYEQRSLKACFLTCRTLAIRCRRRIYRSVRLFDSDDLFEAQRRELWRPSPSLARSFAKLITNKPEIADYVQELVYYVKAGTSDTTSHPVPAALKSLKALKIISIQPDAGYFNWPNVIQSTSWPVVFALMRRPTVTSVKIQFIDNFCISDLAACTRLESLSLIYCTVSKLKKTPPRQPIKLKNLRIWPYKKSVTNLFKATYMDGTPILDRSELRKVAILDADHNVEVDDLGEFLMFMTNLEDLHLKVFPQTLAEKELSKYMPRHLSTPLKTLKVLSLDIFTSDDRSDVSKWFNDLSSENRVETLIICMDFACQYGQTTYLRWDTLKKFILGLQWPFLTRVDLSLSIRRDSEVESHGPVTFRRLSSAYCFAEV